MVKVCLTKKEVLKNPNDSLLGELVRKKFWKKFLKSKKNKNKLKNDTTTGKDSDV